MHCEDDKNLKGCSTLLNGRHVQALVHRFQALKCTIRILANPPQAATYHEYLLPDLKSYDEISPWFARSHNVQKDVLEDLRFSR